MFPQPHIQSPSENIRGGLQCKEDVRVHSVCSDDPNEQKSIPVDLKGSLHLQMKPDFLLLFPHPKCRGKSCTEMEFQPIFYLVTSILVGFLAGFLFLTADFIYLMLCSHCIIITHQARGNKWRTAELEAPSQNWQLSRLLQAHRLRSACPGLADTILCSGNTGLLEGLS